MEKRPIVTSRSDHIVGLLKFIIAGDGVMIRLPCCNYKPVHLKSAAGTAGMNMNRRPQFEPILSGRTTL